ncbi:MAG TPA: response regulator transcription factor [Saprospiraceae bacterium]|nr:response regulator transcription factor [Saprospiraceae bacterium]
MQTDLVLYEDNPYLRESLTAFFESHPDYQLKGAFENCDQVIRQMKELRPKVVLMDIAMEGTNGLEGLRLIRDYDPKILVMMLTVFEDNDHVFDAICRGASGYLLKNTPLEKIPEAIQDLLHGGAPMTPSIARKVIQLFQHLALPREDEYGLSPREREVLALLTSGHSYKMIADKCNISLETVRSHIKKIYEKLQVHSATEAASKILGKKF